MAIAADDCEHFALSERMFNHVVHSIYKDKLGLSEAAKGKHGNAVPLTPSPFLRLQLRPQSSSE